MKKILAIAFAALLGACTNAGPFVTNISADGNNGLVIEKCQVHMNAFMGTGYLTIIVRQRRLK